MFQAISLFVIELVRLACVRLQQHSFITRQRDREKRKMSRIRNISKPRVSRLELCSWTGSYGELQSHVEQCPLHTVQCEHCPDFVVRRDASKHSKVCTGREPCEICGEMVVKGEEQLEKHLKQCLEMESDCS